MPPPRGFQPAVYSYELRLPLPQPGAAAAVAATGKHPAEGYIGIAVNSVLFVRDHYKQRRYSPFNTTSQRVPTVWEFDNCGGHGDDQGRYHYHLPPLCLLEKLGGARPKRGDWWSMPEEESIAQWPSKAEPSPLLGWAFDGTPIYGPYGEDGSLLHHGQGHSSLLDECHGVVGRDGVYRYHMTVTAPYLPPCFRREPAVLRGLDSRKPVHCKDNRAPPTGLSGNPIGSTGDAFLSGPGMVLQGSGCPDHTAFQGVVRRMPRPGSAEERQLCGCGGCGCGCGCGCAGGARAFEWQSKQLTFFGLPGGSPISLTQCNLHAHTIMVDRQQDLFYRSCGSSMNEPPQYSYENGRLKAKAWRRLATGDNTDYALSLDEKYYIIMVQSDKDLIVDSHGHPSKTVKVCETKLSGRQSDVACGVTSRLRMAHALCMILAWCLFLPLGIFASLGFRKELGKTSGGKDIWFIVHRSCNMIGWLLMVAGFVCIIVDVETGSKDHLFSFKAVIGFVVFVLAVLQPFNALIRPHPPKEGETKTMARKLWELLHKGSGWLAFLLALVTVNVGFRHIWGTHTTAGVVVITVWTGFLLFVALALLVKRLYQSAAQPQPKGETSEGSANGPGSDPQPASGNGA